MPASTPASTPCIRDILAQPVALEADVLCLLTVKEAGRSILEILPAQMISRALAQIQGRVASHSPKR